MKKLLKPWYAKLILIIIIGLLIYTSIDEFKKGYAEGKAMRVEAEKAAMKGLTR